MTKIVNELLLRMRAGIYATLDDKGQLACIHRHDRDLLEVVGCGVLLQHHLYTINGPEQAPEAVDEPVYDETAPEQNVELADTNTLIRMLYCEQRPWVLAVMTRGKTTPEPVVPFGYSTWWQGDPIICGGLAGAAVHNITKAAVEAWRPDPDKLVKLIARTVASDFPKAIWTTGMSRALESHCLHGFGSETENRREPE